jgi:dolichyl-diphosphooligosaccharide--protein glycosyltransferase
VAFALRLQPYDTVFQPGLVNFVETDAWFHARVIEDLVANFPHRMEVDPYSLAGGQNVDTGIFFDWLAALVAWLVGMGSPSRETVLHIVAWYPAVLGALLPIPVFLTARRLFGAVAGGAAAIVVSTLPGHLLAVSSLGYSDHHGMEALLTVTLLWLVLRAQEQPQSFARMIGAGLCLAAYLLTFAGGAFVVAVVCLWALHGIVRGQWADGQFPAPQVRPLVGMLLTATPFVLWQWTRDLLWMEYAALAVILAAAGLALLAGWRAFCATKPNARLLFTGGLLLGAAIAVGIVLVGTASSIESPIAVLGRMVAANDTALTVGELQSLTGSKGYFSLQMAWEQFGGAFVLAVIALALLAELAIRKPLPARDLLLFWGATTLLMAAAQVRMTYYFAPCAALLSGFAVQWILQAPGRSRWAVLTVAGALTLLPNLASATREVVWPGALTEDWREATDWLRGHTAEPFGDAASYTVMNWWDSGYWIATAAQRVPVTNPTQQHASEAAKFFLARDEDQAMAILRRWRSRYVALDYRLPFTGDTTLFSGAFLTLFPYAEGRAAAEDYILQLEEPTPAGPRVRRLFFRPAYFESMAVRLFLSGTSGREAVEEDGRFAVVRWETRDGRRILTDHRRFGRLAEAREAEAQCRAQGCVLVSEDPMRPCVTVPPLRHLQEAFASTANTFGLGEQRRGAVQIYTVRAE